jgi:Cu-Zn family superoxide dismutase
MPRFIAPALIALALAGCTTIDNRTTNLGTAQLANAEGRPVGTAVLFRRGSETTVSVTINGMPGAIHGMHLHAVGKCEAPFTSAGPHLNPGGHQHGKDNPQGAHLGDLPNVTIDKAGLGTAWAWAWTAPRSTPPYSTPTALPLCCTLPPMTIAPIPQAIAVRESPVGC